MTHRSMTVGGAAAALLGPITWAVHFLIVYTFESLLCRAATGHWHGFAIATVTITAVAVLVVHGCKRAPRLRIEGADGFLARAALTLDGLSLVAILLVTAVGLALPACR